MVRPKEFRREHALEEAMRVFWTFGFEATSMSDLQRAIGIGRQSLYDTFGDKQTVFAEALQRYIDHSSARNSRLLGGDDGIDAIRAYFSDTIREFAGAKPRRACLMFNACAELSPHDAEIAKLVKKGLKDLRAAFCGALELAKTQGKLRDGADVQTLAMFLTSQVGGLAIIAKEGASRKHMQAVADTALSVLS